ncbi:inorganic phosphate transporter [Alicyclobacillus dauci]|uniref:Anion permease n=1 Tax=Alicyclobacillus dauci TaxID=1475485 RepID=A0ABY6Z712_9BACL|nr:inorganic phosphate transporter [Alicyclobacillus dauci]WAH38693.1 anion permease [Alicyclobacillus dauci]
MQITAWVIALFFAANIGASGTAAAMGSAYGAGALPRRWMALVLVAIGAFLGAVIGGGTVVKTISGGIVPSTYITVEITVLILIAACATLFFSNLIGVPLSTSEVTVGSVVGVGLAVGHVHTTKLIFIVTVWLVMPFIAMFIAFVLGKIVRVIEPKLVVKAKWVTTALTLLLIVAGCYEAFSAGMNNVANAVGPLVASGLLDIHEGLLWGALFVALGAVFLGGRVLETNARKITKLSLLQGAVVSLTSATLVLIASTFGLPVPQTQATTMSIFGVGQSRVGRDIWRQDVVRRIVKIWIMSPVSSLILSYLLVEILVQRNFIPLVIVLAFALVGVGYASVRLRKRRQQLHQGQ